MRYSVCLIMTAVLLIVASTLPGQKVEPKLDGNRPALVIVGGGSQPAEISRTFIDLAGGAQSNIVIIPTASQRADRPDQGEGEQIWRERGAGKVTRLHTRSRDEANEVDFEAVVAAFGIAAGEDVTAVNQTQRHLPIILRLAATRT